MSVYINSAETISAQDTFDTDNFLQEIKTPENNQFVAFAPEYKDYINPRKLRRMSSVIRMGITCSSKALKTAGVDSPDAIIVGTGLGCLSDTIKFLDNMNEQKETLLNPTAFIQSTHNTVSGQIALLLGCKAYNFTFSQQSVSFETALLDAVLKLKEEQINNVLIGALDELTERTFLLLQKANCTKTNASKILNSETNGYVPGEGASFFSLSNQESEKNLAEIKSISLFDLDEEEAINKFLEENKLEISDIDVLISGNNGDVSTDKSYKKVQSLLEQTAQIAYKHLVGEHDSASSFSMWLAAKVIEKQELPASTKMNKINKKTINNVLIHNYSKAHHHSFILISRA